MAGGGNQQKMVGGENAMGIFRWNVDHMPGIHGNVFAVDVIEALRRDDIENVISDMRMLRETTTRLEPNEIATEPSAVRFLGANTATAGDPDQNPARWID